MIAHTTSFGSLVMLLVKKQLFLQAGLVTMARRSLFSESAYIHEFLIIDCE